MRIKKIFRNETLSRFLCWLGHLYIRLVHATSKWTVVRGDIPERFWDRDQPFILGFWHGQLMMMPYCWNSDKAINMLISGHRDGQLIARTVGYFGIRTQQGSSSRGGAAALRAMVKLLKKGECVGITPDGPRGPRMRASSGIVGLARLSGVPIIPATYATNKRKVLGSWDRFIIARPFGRGVIVWGEPIEVARDADQDALEVARRCVEDSLNTITREAVGLCDVETTAPANCRQRDAIMTLAVYRAVATLSLPLIRLYLALRKARGQEDRKRFPERCGIASIDRPAGPLVWLHAASVGESLSMLSLIERIRKDYPRLYVLVTTGTVTSAALMAERLPQGAFHQYVPVDRPSYVKHFLDHWRPDLILWSESEFWPNLVSMPAETGVPMVLINGRVSASSFVGWQRFGGLIRTLLGGFDLCLGQTECDTERLATLGAAKTKCLGNIKFSADELPVDDRELAVLRSTINGRKCWLASSTHAGEEEIAGRVHSTVKGRYPDLLTIIVPRHPGRGAEIADALKAVGLDVARRSNGDPIGDKTDIYIADTMGELGLFYRLVDIVFIGKSLVPLGGQNPLEAARLDCAIALGPHMTNFADIAESLKLAGGAVEVADEAGLATTILRLLDGEEKRDDMATAAGTFASRQVGVLDMVMAELSPFLETCASPGDDHAGP